MTTKEFIENYIKIETKNKRKNIKLTPTQCEFLEKIELWRQRRKTGIVRGITLNTTRSIPSDSTEVIRKDT